ncbi:unnamed protein product [Adineta steineri]|uniref:J domain-containing protein n=1 Tax=Adineta steineri TaxID=433720 RepID=A0A814VI98_9BILA|nr:unnamed protein product [Adineta steineri]CAF3740239.1 unnamed protein product [Adineta steineri]
MFDKSPKSGLKTNQRKNILFDNDDDNLLYSSNEQKPIQSLIKKGYTQQEVAEIKRILSKTSDDYYGILNINKHSTWETIINAHRTLTLRVHPDKVKIPGATEAMQRVNKARTELLKKFQIQRNTQRITTTTPTPFTMYLFTFNPNKNLALSVIYDKSTLTTSTQSVLTTLNALKKNSSSNTSIYLLFTLIIFLIVIIICIVYYKKQRYHLHSMTNENISTKQNIRPIYDSFESNNDEITTTDNED